MIIVDRHECATPVYSMHPINCSTSGINILQKALFHCMNVLRLHLFLVNKSTEGEGLSCFERGVNIK